MGYLKGATFEQAKAIYDDCLNSLMQDQGMTTIGVSGGGESQTLSGSPSDRRKLMRDAYSRMSQLNPTQYPPQRTVTRPNFAGSNL